jgi:hypothetical protein
MEKTKVLNKVKIRKSLRTYGGELLPVGSEITLTEEWESIPGMRCRVILDPHGDRRLVVDEDLEYALGAH